MARATENPWHHLPSEAPFVLPQDERAIDRHNSRADNKTRIVTDLLPEPIVGPIDAPVILLNLNAGFNEQDYDVHSRASFREEMLETIRGEAKRFVYMDEEGPGQRWWKQKLRPLIEATSLDAVATGILSVNLFPYHTKQYTHFKSALSSQRFVLDIVRAAINRKALLVAMRGYERWSVEIRDMGAYRRVLRMTSPQNVTISKGNVLGFDEIVSELRQKKNLTSQTNLTKIEK